MPLSYKHTATKGFDGRLILYYSLLVFIGWLTIFSTSYNPAASQGFSFSLPYVRQLLWIGTSIILAVVILLLDSRIIQHYSYQLYIFCLLLVLSTFFIGLTIQVKNKVDKALKILLLGHGLFFPGCLIMPMTGMFIGSHGTTSGGGVIALEIWCLYFLPIGILSVLHFKSARTSSDIFQY